MANIEKMKLPDGRLVDVEPIDVVQTSENWNQYLLQDGTVIKMKLVASKIVRLIDNYDQMGNPVYFVNSTNVLSLNVPENLKKILP